MIQVVRLKSGEEIITKVEDNGDHILLKSPAILLPTGKTSIALSPWIPYTVQDLGVKISKDYIVFMLEPQTDLKNEYNSAFGSGIVIPNAPSASDAVAGVIGADNDVRSF